MGGDGREVDKLIILTLLGGGGGAGRSGSMILQKINTPASTRQTMGMMMVAGSSVLVMVIVSVVDGLVKVFVCVGVVDENGYVVGEVEVVGGVGDNKDTIRVFLRKFLRNSLMMMEV